MKEQFITIKENGNYYPSRFIRRNDIPLETATNTYKLDEGEEFVIVELSEIKIS